MRKSSIAATTTRTTITAPAAKRREKGKMEVVRVLDCSIASPSFPLLSPLSGARLVWGWDDDDGGAGGGDDATSRRE